MPWNLAQVEHNKGEFRYRVWYEFDKYPMCKEHWSIFVENGWALDMPTGLITDGIAWKLLWIIEVPFGSWKAKRISATEL